MSQKPGSPNDRVRRRVQGAAGYVASTHRLWQRTQADGVPRWALWLIAIAIVVGAAGGVGLYVASGSLLAASIIPGICCLAVVAVLSMADMNREKET